MIGDLQRQDPAYNRTGEKSQPLTKEEREASAYHRAAERRLRFIRAQQRVGL
jgi:hypothetical protein